MVITPSSKTNRHENVDAREQVPVARESNLDRSPAIVVRRPIIATHPIARHALAALRDKHTGPRPLRRFSQQLLTMLAIEATASIPCKDIAVEVSSGTCLGQTVAKPTVFISLARHGLGLSHNIAELIPELSIGSLSIGRSNTPNRIEPRLHLTNAPALHEARVILFDPVVGSGLAAGIALNLLKKSGAKDLLLISFVISTTGVKRVQNTVPETVIVTAAIDDDYDPKRGPLPGLGDFGERMYGS